MNFMEIMTTIKLINRIMECHFFALASMAALLLFMKTNKIFAPRIRRCYYCAIYSVFLVIITDSVVMVLSTQSTPSFAEIFFKAVGYILRPQIAIFILYIVMRNRSRLSVFLWIPQIINILLVFSALFCPLAFSFDAANHFIRGPFNFAPHITGAFYVLCIFYETLLFFKERNYFEGILLLYLIAILALAVTLDVVLQARLTISCAAVCLSFYYLYFHAQSQKRDQLTNAYNRKAFFLDAQKYKKGICALIGFDLNDLKKINDTYGHSTGDEALITMTDVITKLLPIRAKLYRTGGDEFVVLCRRETQKTVEDFVSQVKTQMQQTKYRCAIGIAYRREVFDIDKMYKTADEMMYIDKSEMKAGRNYREQPRDNTNDN